jgi:hypothetical protein
MDRDLYGAQETNGIAPGYHNEPIVGTLDWTSPDLAKITRLRLLSDPGYPAWDVSYCHGENRRGERVNVGLPFSQLPRGRAMRGAIIPAKIEATRRPRPTASFLVGSDPCNP